MTLFWLVNTIFVDKFCLGYRVGDVCDTHP